MGMNSEVDHDVLSEQVAFLNVIMDNNPSLIFLKDESGRYVYLNKTYERQFVGSDNWYGKTDFDFWARESAELFRANDLAVLETGRVTQNLEDSIDKNGTRYCWLNYKFPYTDSSHKRYTGGIGIDIKERIIAEEALREAEESLRISEEKYRSLFSNISEGFFLSEVIYDQEGEPKGFRFLEVNRAYEVHMGIQSDDLIGRTMLEAAADMERFCSEAMRKAAITGGSQRTQGYCENTKKYYEAIVFTPQKGRVAVLLKDITEQKLMEEELKRQSQLSATIIKNISDGLILLDQDNYFTLLNQGAKDFFYQPDQILKKGDSFTNTKYYDLNDNALSAEEMVGCRALKGESVKHCRVKVIRPDRTAFYSMSGSPIYDDKGNVTAAIVCNRDISEQIAAEIMRKETLENAIRMKDEFLTMITHEFKTPLNVINAALQVIEITCGSQLPNHLKKHLNKIKKNSYRQLRLVNNLLDITRYNDDHLKMELQNLDVVHLTEAITNSVDLYAIQKGVNLTFSSEINRLEMALDEEKYERILLNLLSNAIKFTPKGKSIYVQVAMKNNKALITVRDEGIGIPKGKQRLIFDRFGQVDSSLSRRAEGTGIGLSLVKALTSAMNGTIAVSSKIDGGSEFKIVLPITKLVHKQTRVRTDGLQDGRIIQAAAIEFSDHYL